VPCAAEVVTVEVLGEVASQLDSEIIRHAACAVLHYFKNELGRTTVSVGEFTLALERVLQGLGVNVQVKSPEPPAMRIAESDLRRLACESGKGFELAFFPRLRAEIHRQLQESPRLLRFRGLRGCVKQITGARRWTTQCQRLNDQIVDYLRQCLGNQSAPAPCALLVV